MNQEPHSCGLGNTVATPKPVRSWRPEHQTVTRPIPDPNAMLDLMYNADNIFYSMEVGIYANA